MTSSTKTKATEPTMPAGKRVGLMGALALRIVLATMAIGVLSAGSASMAMAEDTCANAAVRAETHSTALPDCRAYEMVSPPYKEGFPVEAFDFSDDGIVSYRSGGNFAGNARGSLLLIGYHATRSSEGWITTAPGPPEAIYNSDFLGPRDAESADLRSSLWLMSRRDVPGETFGYWLRGPEGAFTRVGDADTMASYPRPATKLVSADLSHIVFNHAITGSAEGTALWEYVGTGNGLPREVSVDNDGQPTPGETCPNAMSDDGRVVVYTAGCFVGTAALWSRVAGSASVAVSGSECTRSSGDPGGVCNGVSPASYAGVARNGSRVFFTTSQQLVNGDTDTGNDLYACDIPVGVPAPVGTANACASLTQVSGTATNAQVENVVAVSDDGSRVYFVAQGVLADNTGVGDVRAATPSDLCCGQQQPHNMYMWERDAVHPAGQTKFVARVPSNDLSPPQQSKAPEITPDGRYLLFMSSDGLVAGDTDGARDVYRYDANSGVLLRVSTSVAGGGGNDSAAAASVGRLSSISADGSTVIFETAEALAQGDTNGVKDVYSWRDGQVSLISSGGGSVVGITPSGRDMFFLNQGPVLAADGDVIVDIYDARIGGGFKQPPPAATCAGDQCQGLRSQPPGLAGPSGRTSGRGGSAEAPPAFSVRAVSAAQRKKLAATGRASLTVSTSAAGTIGVKATATIGGRSVTVGSAKRTLTAPGSVAVGLTLSKKARAQLAARGRLTVKVAVSHSKVALDRSVTLKLVHTKKSVKGASMSRGGGRS